MKIAMTALATLLLGAGAALAAMPAQVKTSSTTHTYTDSKGMTLYTFDKDTSGKSTCDGDCAMKWMPLKADNGAKADGDFTLVKRTDGSMMWALKGMPLYTFQGDKKAGDMMGDGMNGTWHAAKAM